MSVVNGAYRTRERKSVFKRLPGIVLLLLASVTLSPAQQTTPPVQVTVIRAGKLVDVDAGRILTNQMLVVRSRKLEAMGENWSVPAGAPVIDLTKMTMLQARIDCQTHLAERGGDEARQ